VAAELATTCNLGETVARVYPAWRYPHKKAHVHNFSGAARVIAGQVDVDDILQRGADPGQDVA